MSSAIPPPRAATPVEVAVRSIAASPSFEDLNNPPGFGEVRDAYWELLKDARVVVGDVERIQRELDAAKEELTAAKAKLAESERLYEIQVAGHRQSAGEATRHLLRAKELWEALEQISKLPATDGAGAEAMRKLAAAVVARVPRWLTP